MNINKYNFKKNGFFRGKFNKKSFYFLKKLRLELELSLIKITKIKNIKFSNFHNYDFSRDEIIKIQKKFKKIIFNNINYSSFIKFFVKDIEFLLGPDISYQASPWPRVSRPMKFEDNSLIY